MNLPSESTKLEGSGSFTEYKGSGKLNNKNALITGGEYVQCQPDARWLMSLQFWNRTIGSYSDGKRGRGCDDRLSAGGAGRCRGNKEIC